MTCSSRCGRSSYGASSTRLRSTRISRTSSGRARISRLVMSALTHTLLPEPVAPAIEQVGHPGQVDRIRLARHVAAEGERQLAGRVAACSRPRASGRNADDLADVVGDLDADDVLARDRRLDADRARGEGHRQVVGERLDARQLDARVGPDLVLGHDRAAVRRRRPVAGIWKLQQLLLDDAGCCARGRRWPPSRSAARPRSRRSTARQGPDSMAGSRPPCRSSRLLGGRATRRRPTAARGGTTGSTPASAAPTRPSG